MSVILHRGVLLQLDHDLDCWYLVTHDSTRNSQTYQFFKTANIESLYEGDHSVYWRSTTKNDVARNLCLLGLMLEHRRLRRQKHIIEWEGVIEKGSGESRKSGLYYVRHSRHEQSGSSCNTVHKLNPLIIFMNNVVYIIDFFKIIPWRRSHILLYIYYTASLLKNITGNCSNCSYCTGVKQGNQLPHRSSV